MDWHLFSLSKIKLVASELVSHLLDTEPSPEERASLSVLWEYKVMILEGSRGADAGSLFAKLGHVE